LTNSLCFQIQFQIYYKLITTASSLGDIKLSSNDDLIYKDFKETFPDLNVENLTEDAIKSEEGMWNVDFFSLLESKQFVALDSQIQMEKIL